MASRLVLPSERCVRCRRGFGVAAGAGDGDAVDGGVDLAVAAAVEAVGGWSSGADRGRRTAACAASLASLAKRWAPAISPISLPAVNGPKPGSVSSWARAGRQARRALARGLRWCARACACGAVSSPSAGPSPQAGRHRRNPNSKRESESPGDPAKPGRSGEIGAGNPIALGSRGTSSSPCRPIRPRVGSWRSTSSTSIPWRTGMVQRPFVSADIVSS
jgi:hypothetical protein